MYDVDNLTEEQTLEVGLSLADFMNTPAGVWFIAKLKEKANKIAQEAVLSDDPKTPIHFWKGRLYEVRELLIDLEALAGHAVGVVREKAIEEEAARDRKDGKKPKTDNEEESLMIPRSGSGTISAPTSFGQE
jgi:hypothetical protein